MTPRSGSCGEIHGAPMAATDTINNITAGIIGHRRRAYQMPLQVIRRDFEGNVVMLFSRLAIYLP